MKKALYTVKLPKPRNAAAAEGLYYDKQSEYINVNFKQLFDAILDLEAANAELRAALKAQEEA